MTRSLYRSSQVYGILRRKIVAQMINEKWEFIKNKYIDIQRKYSDIHTLMTDKVYPEYLRDLVNTLSNK
jgi:hypothetical protein